MKDEDEADEGRKMACPVTKNDDCNQIIKKLIFLVRRSKEFLHPSILHSSIGAMERMNLSVDSEMDVAEKRFLLLFLFSFFSFSYGTNG
jgi:hypothetical protein